MSGVIDVLGFVIQGVFIAIGTAIGTYLANKGVINHIDKLTKIIKERGLRN